MNKPRKKRDPNAGLTVLEVMVVLAILALIVGLAAPRVLDSLGRAKTQTAEIQLNNLKSALQLFYVDTGRYPTNSEGLAALTTAPRDLTGWQGPYIDGAAAMTDPWGRRYLLEVPGSDRPFVLRSYGRDGQPGGDGEDADIDV